MKSHSSQWYRTFLILLFRYIFCSLFLHCAFALQLKKYVCHTIWNHVFKHLKQVMESSYLAASKVIVPHTFPAPSQNSHQLYRGNTSAWKDSPLWHGAIWVAKHYVQWDFRRFRKLCFGSSCHFGRQWVSYISCAITFSSVKSQAVSRAYTLRPYQVSTKN